MNFNEYQKMTSITALHPNASDNLPYLALGIAGKAGEIADKVKKYIRDCGFTSISDLTVEQKQDLAKEIGDVLWHTAQIAQVLGFDLESIAEMNIEKTHSRLAREKLHGEGDNR